MLTKIPSTHHIVDDDSDGVPDLPDGAGAGDGYADIFYEGVWQMDRAMAYDEDFADYLWMVDEEEFDNQEMQRLEEEALTEQCIEAMVELSPIDEMDEAMMRLSGDDSDEAAADSNTAAIPMIDNDAADGGSSEVSQELCRVISLLAMANTDTSTESKLVERSNLNPMAEEFVPADLTHTCT